MRIFVKYGRDGQILGVSKVEVMPPDMDQPFEPVGDDEAVIEAPAGGDVEQLDPLEILGGYRVDTKKKKLVKQAG